MECWEAFFSDDISAQERQSYERHLETCSTCQARLDQTEGTAEPLLELVREFGDPADPCPDPMLAEVMQRLHEAKSLTRAGVAEPADLYFLQPTDRPGLLGMLGQYEVSEMIGQGGMGLVLKAFDPTLHRLVAIKVMAAAVAGSATARRRFTREAQAAGAVCHDHIVTVHSVAETDGLPYLVMQYVPGESLQGRLDRARPLEVIEIVRIGLQTALGLAAAHAQGLIHRDIKPANLLLENGLARVRITDFGLARMVDDVALTQNGVVAGTPEYMAPEQARGEAIDHRADLFSLGSVLFAMCTGSPPFRGSTAVAVLRQVSDEAATSVRVVNPDVPIWLAALVDRLLAKDPAHRFQSAAEVAELLEGYLAHLRQPAIVRAPNLPPFPVERTLLDPPTQPGTASARGRALLALLLLAVAGAGLVSWLARPGRQTVSRAADDRARSPGELTAVFHQDLRTPDLNSSVLRPMGTGFRPEAQGARITLTADEGVPSSGLATNFQVHGDFEITVSYEILMADIPNSGYGVGVNLYVAINPENNDAVTLARRTFTDGRTVFISNRMTPTNGKLRHKTKTLPSTATTGKLRIRRVGSKVSFLVVEGDRPDFALVDELEFDKADIRFVETGGSTGRAKCGLNILLLDLTIRAEALPGLAEANADVPSAIAPGTATKGGLAAGLLVALFITLSAGVGLWLFVRRRAAVSSADIAGAERHIGPGPAGPESVSFPCSGCGRKFRAKPELMGKKDHMPPVSHSEPCARANFRRSQRRLTNHLGGALVSLPAPITSPQVMHLDVQVLYYRWGRDNHQGAVASR
jgi:serine/threonine protein kinase